MHVSLFTVSAAAMLLCSGSLAQTDLFEDPVPLNASGDTFSKILYPSPVLFDVDGDGHRDLVIGDLRGYLQSCAPKESVASGGNDLTWSAIQNLQSDGKPLKLHNW